MTDITEQELVSRCLKGDTEAFGGIVERYQGLICALTFSGSGNVPLSEEMAQQTFVIAWRRLGQLRDCGRLKSWLCGIARNVIRTQRREIRRGGGRGNVEGMELAALGDTPEQSAIRREEELLVQRALAAIPERYREPLVLFYREDQSVQSVAAALELSEDAARQRLSRGRKMLKAQVAGVVEQSLGRSKPGNAFAIGVVALLPALTVEASAVGLGAAASKGVPVAKSLLSMGWLFVLFTPVLSLVATAFAARAADRWSARTGRSLVERRFMFGFAWTIGIITAACAIPIGVVSADPDLIVRRPLLWGLVLGGTIAAQVGLVVLLSFWANRRLKQIRLRASAAPAWIIAALILPVIALTPDASASPPRTEVVIVATQHFISDMPDGYTPGHLRALLTKIAPDVLAVEAPTNVPDPWSHAPYELATVTRPWAIEHAIPIVPAGIDEPQYGMQLSGMFREITAAGNGAAYEKTEREFQQAFASQAQTCQGMNSAAALGLWRSYHAELHRLCGGDTPWERWNESIVANIVKICRDHTGKRVAVVFGGAHAYYFADRLGKEPSVGVIDVAQFFPIRDEQVRAHTQDADYVRALRLLNFMPGAIGPQQLTQLEQKLARFKELKELGNDYELFSGKLLLHQGKLQEALKVFSKLSKLPGNVKTAFDGTTSIRDTARFLSGITRKEQGDLGGAQKDLPPR